MRTAIRPAERLILALDVSQLTEMERLLDQVGDLASTVKIGLELYTAAGPAAVAAARRRGAAVFLDLKYHDIPATVERAVLAAGRLGVEFLTVHVAGGREMLRRAVGAAEGAVRLLGVTVLTSWDEASLAAEVGLRRNLSDQVLFWAELGRECGLAGVVASPQEAAAVKGRCGADFLVVTPGIRPAWAVRDDQRRVATPRAALEAGSDYLVVGRPVTQAADPREAIRRTLAEMAG
ncbi:MAG: orotidine-5'-phosphate decarboxylase [Thermaerobacter sp.]|nr:orotidine-5'-phosphate decarboxylase [Thermaerobacter sp.]MDA8146701.1 orotidine-5'-phosphate decarboxylase [Thermaerobacter sp.]